MAPFFFGAKARLREALVVFPTDTFGAQKNRCDFFTCVSQKLNRATAIAEKSRHLVHSTQLPPSFFCPSPFGVLLQLAQTFAFSQATFDFLRLI